MENGQKLGQTDFELLIHAAEKHVFINKAEGLEIHATNKRRVKE